MYQSTMKYVDAYSKFNTATIHVKPTAHVAVTLDYGINPILDLAYGILTFHTSLQAISSSIEWLDDAHL